jgi:hypothetical protein
MLHGIPHSIFVLAYSACGMTVVLVDLDFRRRGGGSCARLGAASRVVLSASASGRRPYAGLRVSLMGELWWHGGQRGDVSSEQGFTASVMAPQHWGWPHSAGDGRTGVEMAKGTCSTDPASRCRPNHAPGQRSYTLRGCSHGLSMGSMWRKDERRRHNALE